MPRLYGPDAKQSLEALRFKTNTAPGRGRHTYSPYCEQCGRETEFLFAGPITTEPSKYRREPGRMTGQERETLVCFSCRPASNLEVEEILNDGYYKGQCLELEKGN